MLSIHPPHPITSSTRTPNLTPNLLPCKIHHSGPIKVSKRYWSPTTNPADQPQTSYLRGRKLRGREVKVPQGYRGYILQKDGKTAQAAGDVEVRGEEGEEDEEAEAEAGRTMEVRGTFDSVMVWGHDMMPADEDEYVKGVEEWIGFAEAVSGLLLLL